MSVRERGPHPADPPDVDTNLVDLSNASLDDLRNGFEQLRGPVDVLLAQVARPRLNLGNHGPPGRAD
jgi:hypothetical protein